MREVLCLSFDAARVDLPRVPKRRKDPTALRTGAGPIPNVILVPGPSAQRAPTAVPGVVLVPSYPASRAFAAAIPGVRLGLRFSTRCTSLAVFRPIVAFVTRGAAPGTLATVP
jgi:hypothetical protein